MTKVARVGIDLDGVCYDFAGALRYYLVSEHGFSAEAMPEPTCWEFYSNDWNITSGEFVSFCDAGVNAGVIFTHGDPIEDAANQLRRLRAAGHTIHIITDRSFGANDGEASREATKAWLRLHGIPYDTLDFTADKTSVPTDVMIDDKVENVDALILADCDALLLDRPWNRDGRHRDRVVSLEKFVDYVLDEYNNFAAPLTGEVRTTSSTGGQKGVKPQRFDLIPVHPLTVLAEHYGKGAAKYDDHQWMKGYEWSKSYAAMMRHLTKWWGGEDFDAHEPDCKPDCVEHTESHHVTAGIWHGFAILQFIRDYPQFDDRPQSSLREMAKAAQDWQAGYDSSIKTVRGVPYPDVVDGDGDTWEFHHLHRGVPQYVMTVGSGVPRSEEEIRARHGLQEAMSR